MCHRKVLVMILKSYISFFRKLFESNMYFISTETGKVVFDPQAVSDDSITTDAETEE